MHLLLLHGAGLGRWIWDRVLPHLTVPAEALDLPGRTEGRNPGDVTLQECIDFTAGRARDDSVLVGHSFSAQIALGVASARRVAGVVLVGGVVPESGRSFVSLLPFPQRLVLTLMLKRARNGIRLPQSLVKKEYCNDLDAATTEAVLAKVVPEAPHIYLDRLEWSLPAFYPRTYVKLLNDRSVKPSQQDRMIARLHSPRVETLDTGHLPMLGRPAELAAVLNRLATP